MGNIIDFNFQVVKRNILHRCGKINSIDSKNSFLSEIKSASSIVELQIISEILDLEAENKENGFITAD